MQIGSKKHWDIFIYGLLYPGFVGSMIYELIPPDNDSSKSYWEIETAVKLLITVFYCIDYLHLYGDMHDIVKPEKRESQYLWCDVGSSLFFFLSFVFVKHNAYLWSLLFISIVPVFFLIYKKKNANDKKIHGWFLGFTMVGFMLFIVTSIIMPGWIFYEPKWFLFWYVLLELLFYCYYVFIYYEKYSKPIDKELYPE